MRSPIALVLLVVAVSVAQTSHALDAKSDSFRQCAEEMVLWTLRRADGEFDIAKVVNEVLADCFLKAPDAVLVRGPQSDAWMAQAKRDIALLVDKLAPRAKAEKADQDQIGANYYLCLLRHAKVFALASDEAADIIAKASLSACPAERAAVFEVHKRYKENWTEGAMKAMERVLAQRLLLEIVALRAQRNITPAPAPEEPSLRKTPI